MSSLKVFSVKSENESKGSVILLHGYGANGRDLMGIAHVPFLSSLDLDWYFLEAPLSPPELAAFGGKAWFNLSVQSFMNNMSSGSFEDFYSKDNSDFHKSFEAINQSIWDLDLKTSKNFIGGFSQGAMMSAHVFFSSSVDWSGALFMSGAPYLYSKWGSKASQAKVFQSHGEQDQVLPLQCGQDFAQRLKEKDAAVESHWFQGGHEIPISALRRMADFLKSN